MSIVDILRVSAYFFGIIASIIGIIVGGGAIIGFFIGRRKHWFRPLAKMTNTFNTFMAEILPSLLGKFIEKGLAPADTLVKWSGILSSDKFSISSPKQLNEKGQKLLEESGIKKIIDDNLEKFLSDLEKKNPKIPQDVENYSFNVIKEIENTEIDIPLRNYFYNNNDVNIYSIFFIGSIYLRDKYFAKYPVLLTNSSSNSI